jgi:LacI family transcriptional regulator, repressor for deo operon, udp, cdd, tsx, nupC, and nupG
MTTIEEVALRAKVSVATVSRVINDKGNVSPATAERVRIAIKELKYQPNAMGVLLRRERTGMVLILLHSVDNPFFSSIVQGVEKIAHENDYNVLISTTYGDQAREKRYIKLLQRHFVDGVILITNTLNREEIQELNAQFPVAQVLEYVEGSETTHISVDFYQAGRTVMEHLIESGRKRIAFAHTGLIDIISTKRLS